MRCHKKNELILYLTLWTLLFAAPVISAVITLYYPSQSSMAQDVVTRTTASFDWDGVLSAWKLLAMFFTVFCLHNFLLAPMLVYRNRKWAYCVSVLLLLACFSCYQRLGRPHPPIPRGGDGMKPAMERRERPPHEMEHQTAHQMNRPMQRPMERPDEHPDDRKAPKHEPPQAFGGEDSVAFIIMILLMGLNIGAKYFFKSLDDRKRMKLLEKENLSRQLEYLKYQINPHFFMNTLNNIHALVDIDPEQAKHTIEVLSKLMRYTLYEGNKTMAPLKKELDFITHYIDLMRIRYTDKVRIDVSLPMSVPDVQVPPLLFTTFVENAFKHGVSYQQDSFIEVRVTIDEYLKNITFICRNSKKPEAEDSHGGVGLQNAQKRLQLIYGNRYMMRTEDSKETYQLTLQLPILHQSDTPKESSAQRV